MEDQRKRRSGEAEVAAQLEGRLKMDSLRSEVKQLWDSMIRVVFNGDGSDANVAERFAEYCWNAGLPVREGFIHCLLLCVAENSPGFCSFITREFTARVLKHSHLWEGMTYPHLLDLAKDSLLVDRFKPKGSKFRSDLDRMNLDFLKDAVSLEREVLGDVGADKHGLESVVNQKNTAILEEREKLVLETTELKEAQLRLAKMESIAARVVDAEIAAAELHDAALPSVRVKSTSGGTVVTLIKGAVNLVMESSDTSDDEMEAKAARDEVARQVRKCLLSERYFRPEEGFYHRPELPMVRFTDTLESDAPKVWVEQLTKAPNIGTARVDSVGFKPGGGVVFLSRISCPSTVVATIVAGSNTVFSLSGGPYGLETLKLSSELKTPDNVSVFQRVKLPKIKLVVGAGKPRGKSSEPSHALVEAVWMDKSKLVDTVPNVFRLTGPMKCTFTMFIRDIEEGEECGPHLVRLPVCVLESVRDCTDMHDLSAKSSDYPELAALLKLLMGIEFAQFNFKFEYREMDLGKFVPDYTCEEHILGMRLSHETSMLNARLDDCIRHSRRLEASGLEPLQGKG